MAEQSRSTAELIVECLENEGVTHVFGIPGEENIRLVAAISRSCIQYVLVRHEQPVALDDAVGRRGRHRAQLHAGRRAGGAGCLR